MANNNPRWRALLREWQLNRLFVEELNWNNGAAQTLTLTVAGVAYHLRQEAERSGVALYSAEVPAMPDGATLDDLEKQLLPLRKHHVVALREHGTEHHLWMCRIKRDGGAKNSRIEYREAAQADLLLEKLPLLHFATDDEVPTLDVANRLQQAFALNAEAITKQFYEQFKKEHDAFAAFIEGLDSLEERRAYTSRMLNRLMFCYFLQKRGYLDHRVDYLAYHLSDTQQRQGRDQFHATFFRGFLLGFFGRGLNSAERDEHFRSQYGRIPYINGGMFALAECESGETPGVDIPDEAFERLFTFFDRYQWHLDTRATASGRDINPDVLGYIFEQYINDRAANGAYYTKEDVTGYIAANTIVPKLLQMTSARLREPFAAGGYVWLTLRREPERFVHAALLKGYTPDWRERLPDDIRAGMTATPDDAPDPDKRRAWARPADDPWANPTESWRETIERLTRCEALLDELANGRVDSIDKLVTSNLDLQQFLLTLTAEAPDHKLPHHLYQALRSITILDPTCGSGAFLFAALELLLPLYDAALDRIRDLATTSADCRNDLQQAHLEAHPNQQYFELKSIILRNLYGVDLMGEAVEIARLRLFLKLVSAANAPDDRKPNLGIEPLPDIDFNLKVGNALVGYARTRDADGLNEGRLDVGNTEENVRRQVNLVNDAIRIYKESQLRQGVTGEELNDMKRALRPQLDELDKALDEHYFRNNGQKGHIATWRRNTHPLHWVAQFNDILEAGGFDVVIGNPPYVGKTKIGYYVDFLTAAERKMPDIYAWCVLRALSLTADDGMLGMIMPLSVTFSGDFQPLREALNGRNVWMASFNNRPATLFANVLQRCTIMLTYASPAPQLLTSPMLRWKSEARAALMSRVNYTNAELFRNGTWPKLYDDEMRDILAAIGKGSYSNYKSSEQHVFFSTTGGNFISISLEEQPVIDATTLTKLKNNSLALFSVENSLDRYAVYAATSGNLAYLLWQMAGDSFHLTAGNLTPIISTVHNLSSDVKEQLATIGHLLSDRDVECLSFLKYAGKYVGSYNHAPLRSLTRRADALLLFALGLNKRHVLAMVEWYMRSLSANSNIVKKGIPEELAALYPPKPYDRRAHARALSEIDATLLGYGLTRSELRYLTEIDLSPSSE